MSIIDVSDLDLSHLLVELWRNQKIPDYFAQLSFMAPYEPDREQIESLLKNGYVGYIAGKYINTNFSNPARIDTSSYNKEAGLGTFEKVVSKLRKTIIT